MSLVKHKMSYLTHPQYVAMVFSRFIRDVDSLKYLMKIWKTVEETWLIEWYAYIHQNASDFVCIQDRLSLHFDIGHFYPRFLSVHDPLTRSYQDMTIKSKVKLIERLNKDKETIGMRRKSMYLFQRNRIYEHTRYPAEDMVMPMASQYIVGVMGYTER